MALYVGFKLTFEIEPDSIYEAFKVEFEKLFLGSISLAFNFPGTNYNIGLEVRVKSTIFSCNIFATYLMESK